jgi:hypothetical protein
MYGICWLYFQCSWICTYSFLCCTYFLLLCLVYLWAFYRVASVLYVVDVLSTSFSVKFRITQWQKNLLALVMTTVAPTLVGHFVEKKLTILQNWKSEWEGYAAHIVHSCGYREALRYISDRSWSTAGENIKIFLHLRSKCHWASMMKLILGANLYFSITTSVFYRFFGQ